MRGLKHSGFRRKETNLLTCKTLFGSWIVLTFQFLCGGSRLHYLQYSGWLSQHKQVVDLGGFPSACIVLEIWVAFPALKKLTLGGFPSKYNIP